MKSPKTLLYALLARVGVGVYAFRKLGIRDPKVGLLGAILGLAGGVYLDRGRAERDLGDNLAFGLILSAFLRLADILYGISMLTPQSRKLGLITLSLVAMGSALASETSIGKPGKVPILGILAILVAFLLVFSSVHSAQLQKVETIEIETLKAEVSYTSSYSERTSNSSFITIPEEPNQTILAINLKFKPTLEPGEYNITIIFSPAVAHPRVVFLDQEILPGKPDEQITILTITLNITPSEALRMKADGRSGVYLDRHDRIGFNDSTRPKSLAIQVEISKLAETSISKAYLLGAMALLLIAIIDALPIESTRKITRRTRRKKRKTRKR